MGLFRKYRIEEINGKFIPQVRQNLIDWEGIDKDGSLWFNEVSQLKYCGCYSKEDAIEILNKYSYSTNGKIHKYPKDKTWMDILIGFFFKE
jgi:hypothetical protein